MIRLPSFTQQGFTSPKRSNQRIPLSTASSKNEGEEETSEVRPSMYAMYESMPILTETIPKYANDGRPKQVVHNDLLHPASAPSIRFVWSSGRWRVWPMRVSFQDDVAIQRGVPLPGDAKKRPTTAERRVGNSGSDGELLTGSMREDVLELFIMVSSPFSTKIRVLYAWNSLDHPNGSIMEVPDRSW